MIPKEEYAANEWFATSSEDTEVKGIYTFSLDWSKASQPTVTVTRAEKPMRTTLTPAQTEPNTFISEKAYVKIL